MEDEERPVAAWGLNTDGGEEVLWAGTVAEGNGWEEDEGRGPAGLQFEQEA